MALAWAMYLLIGNLTYTKYLRGGVTAHTRVSYHSTVLFKNPLLYYRLYCTNHTTLISICLEAETSHIPKRYNLEIMYGH